MIRFDRNNQALALGVSLLAGFVDALGFIESAGFFVSFMTGNSTRLAVGVAEQVPAAGIAGGIIALFVAGVVAGSLVGSFFGQARTRAVLAMVTVLLVAAALLRTTGLVWPVIACLAFAMGAVNAALEGQGGLVVGVTYMTGTLVQMGQKIANALRGAGDRQWLPHLGLWAGLVTGAMVGARTALWSPFAAYWIAASLGASLILWAIIVARRSAAAPESR